MENKNKKKVPLMIGSVVILVALVLAVVSMIFVILGELGGNAQKPGDISSGQEDELNPGEENEENEGSQNNNSGNQGSENTGSEDTETENDNTEHNDNSNDNLGGEETGNGNDDSKEENQDNKKPNKVENEDPQNGSNKNPGKENGSGANVDVLDAVDKNETKEITLGIDVSKYQGKIDWKKVADAGIDFVMVRVGYRELAGGKIVADSNAKYNMQEAQKYGIKVGAYFFSTAISKEEAIEEANWVADYISKYKITYPVAYNCEGFLKEGSRQYHMTKTERTDVALAFLKRVKERGYTPMFYASKSEMTGNAQWETSRIDGSYKIWVAQYPSAPYPETEKSSYTGKHAMWQYTSLGTIAGISQPVDVNIAYFGYDKTQDAQDRDPEQEVLDDPEALMNFKDVNETVTAKDRTNLRNRPSQGSDSKVLYTLANGETATRTGISDSGWSRVVFNGKTYYAVSSFLTTDLNYKAPTPTPTPTPEDDDGVKTEFKEVHHKVTAKEAVNLRTLPSVTHEDSQVVVQIKNGDVVIRTGINTDLGWSRVEYNGQTLYCVSSYLMTVE